MRFRIQNEKITHNTRKVWHIMTALILGTQTMTRSFLVGWALATGKINKTFERIGKQRAAHVLACYGHYDIAKTLTDSLKDNK